MTTTLDPKTMNLDEQALRKIAALVAMRGFHYNKEWLVTILDGIQRIIIAGGYASDIDVM
jgi:hypothetical protein